MRVRFFGEPWGSEGQRAPICEDDTYRIPVPVGEKCIECTKAFVESDHGVVTACSAGVWGHFFIEIGKHPHPAPDLEYEVPAGRYSVCAYHLLCWLEVVFGNELSEIVTKRMDFKIDDDDPVRQDVSDDANVTPGSGWVILDGQDRLRAIEKLESEGEDGEAAGQE